MTLTSEQIVSANKANLETLVGLTTKAFSGVEELIELNLAAAKSAMADSQEHLHASLSVKDAQELLALQSSLFQPLAEKAVAYNRHLYEIASGAGAYFQGTVEGKAAQAQQAFHALVDNAAKNAPAGTEAAVAVFKTAVAAGNNALETVQKAVKQASEVAESNYKTMSANALNAASATSTASRKPAAKKR
ncbi:MAG: TIGR01841 family phasin [Burkholderiales bacterium]|nr:TIGR01841 family phasin [Burkholderiales bacterium]